MVPIKQVGGHKFCMVSVRLSGKQKRATKLRTGCDGSLTYRLLIHYDGSDHCFHTWCPSVRPDFSKSSETYKIFTAGRAMCWPRGSLSTLIVLYLVVLDRYRVTVIRNLPQLQKLDNIAVQPDEMADAVRRGIELIHPLDRDTTSYTSYQQPQVSLRFTN